jgi:rfaE bifunctional protein nucleotidyltransferase chain/domain
MIQASGDYLAENIVGKEVALAMLSKHKAEGKKIGLCVGAYDLMHPGHIKHLESAKEICDVLLVGITSDVHVNSRKSYDGPVFSEQLRAFSVSRLKSVDYVIINDDKTADALIKALRPDFYIKGPDYIGKNTEGIMREKEAIESVGGRLMFTNDEKLSSTELIRFVKKI